MCKNEKKTFVLGFKWRKKNKKTKLTSWGGAKINVPLLSGCIFVSTQSRLGFGITYCTVCFSCREQTVRLATEGLSVPISDGYNET